MHGHLNVIRFKNMAETSNHRLYYEYNYITDYTYRYICNIYIYRLYSYNLCSNFNDLYEKHIAVGYMFIMTTTK